MDECVRTVVLHAWSATKYGKKRSKSKGNGVDPARLGGCLRRRRGCAAAWPGAPTTAPTSRIGAEWVQGSRTFATRCGTRTGSRS